jgi:hypothetical protein
MWMDIPEDIRNRLSIYNLNWNLCGTYVGNKDSEFNTMIFYSNGKANIQVQDCRLSEISSVIEKPSDNKFTVVDNFKIYKYEKVWYPAEEIFSEKLKERGPLTRKEYYGKFRIRYKRIFN